MKLLIKPATLSGAITPPPSKSQAHRLLIAAALAGDGSHIENLADSEDILATRQCLAAIENRASEVNSAALRCSAPSRLSAGPIPILDCRESGSTLRFLIPVALALHGAAHFTGQGRLLARPLSVYESMFPLRPKALPDGRPGIFVEGGLRAGRFSMPGDVSSQFVSGLLFALPLLAGDSDIMLTSPLESRGYVDMTIDALARFGVTVETVDDRRFHIPGGQRYRPAAVAVEPDYSQAAFYFAANGIGNSVDIQGLQPNSKQGDRVILDYHAALCGGGTVTLDVSQCPDLVPPLALHAALRAGETTHIVGAARLRIKESDRLETVTSELCKLGGDITQSPDSLTIRGVPHFGGGSAPGLGVASAPSLRGAVDSVSMPVEVCAHNDHRIAMMLAIAATRMDGEILLDGAESVAKSYPNFWAHYRLLNGNICEIME